MTKCKVYVGWRSSRETGGSVGSGVSDPVQSVCKRWNIGRVLKAGIHSPRNVQR